MATKTSAGTGNWSTVSWTPSAPVPGDDVVIRAGDVVTLDSSVDIGSNPANTTTIVLAINGTLKLIDNPSVDITFTVRGNIRIAALGKLSLGTASVPLPSTRKFILDFSQGNGGWYIHLDGHATVPASGAVLEGYGTASYHMADAAKQRTTLAAAASLGSNVAIQFSDAVDYYADPTNGDMVWLAMGGDRNTLIIDQTTGNLIAGYGQEKVRLKTKTSPTTYTADLTYNHLAGDMVVHGSRNLILRGATAKGFSILVGSTASRTIPFLDLNWATLEYACSAGANCAIYLTDAVWLTTQYLEGSEIKVKNSLIDTPATGTTPYAVYMVGGYLTPNIRMKTTGIDELHIWGYSTGFLSVNHLGMTLFGHVSVLGVKTSGAAQAWGIYCGLAPFKCTELWYCADVLLNSTGIQGAFFAGNSFEIESIKSHCSYQGPYANLVDGSGSSGGTSTGSVHYIGGGEMFNSKNGFTISGAHGRRTHFKQIKFANMYLGAILFGATQAQTDILFEDCEFDRCCYQFPAGGGTAAVVAMVSYGDNSFHFVRCKFGVTIRNYTSNVKIGDACWWGGQGRIIFEDCEVKQPQGVELTMTALTDAIKWHCHPSSDLTPTKRKQQLPLRTFEFIRPKAYNSAGVDQWPVSYPGVTHLALTGGGGEVRNEETVIRDGSFATKILPYTYLVENSGTRRTAIKIPVDRGQAVTVKLYVRKNHTVPVGQRPGIRLEGLGIYEFVEMSDAIDTWEQLTVSGTALVAGFVEFWVHPGFNDKKTDGGGPSAWTPEDLGHIVVYADELAITMGSLVPETPEIVTGVAAFGGDQIAIVMWDPGDIATSYNIYWSLSPGVTKLTGTKIAGVTSPYVHTGRTNGTPYYYIVTAVNGAAESDDSLEANVTPSVFNPAGVSGIAVWLKADAITGLNDGDAVASWLDSSGLSNNASQSSPALRPVYKTAILNSKPVVRFTVNDQYLDLLSALTAVRTVFCVTKWSAIASYSTFFGHGSSYDWIGALAPGWFDPANANDYVKNGAGFINGAQVTPVTSMNKSTSAFQIMDLVTTGNTYVTKISKDRTQTHGDFAGDTPEILIYTSALSTSNRQKIEGYLAWKYDLQGNLPVGHPYKAAPP